MAKNGFSLVTPLGVVAVRPEELWRGANLLMTAATNRARTGLTRLADNVATVAAREGDGLLQAARQDAQAVQALAAQAPRLAGRVPMAPTGLPEGQLPARAEPAPKLQARKHFAGQAREALMTADAAVRGAADTLTFSTADEITAGLRSAFDFSEGSYLEKYGRYHQAELERDQYDSENRAIGRAVGRAIGLLPMVGARTSATLLRNGAPKVLSELRGGQALGAVPRIKTTGREAAVASAAGGLVNGAIETGVDLATGGHGNFRDHLGAVVGGVVSTPVAIFGSPSTAGAVEGLVTSASQDILNGRPISFDAAVDSSARGATGAHVGDVLGSAWAKALSSQRKGKLGEALSVLKTRARGGVPIGRNERRYLSRSYTVVDPASTATTTVESKNGPFAEFTPQQLLGWTELPDYRVDWWQPSDVGRGTAFGGASLMTNLGLADPSPPAPPRTPPRF